MIQSRKYLAREASKSVEGLVHGTWKQRGDELPLKARQLAFLAWEGLINRIGKPWRAGRVSARW